MSIPEPRLSSAPVIGTMLYPDNLVTSATRDYEMGGIALSDPSRGLQYQPWEFWLVPPNEVRCKPLNDSGDGIPLIATSGEITSISGTFDRNMRPCVAYTEQGTAKLWWYDSVPAMMVVTAFPGATQPRVAHDDKRDGSAATSDIILAYVMDGVLYTREQRDRFELEYLTATGLDGMQLKNFGMTNRLRLQFELGR